MPRIADFPTKNIHDWNTFHDVSAAVFGFPDWYGRNMDAWCDCLSSVDQPDNGLIATTVVQGDELWICLRDSEDFVRRCPEQFEKMSACIAAINAEQIANGRPNLLVLARGDRL